jgi:phosphatidylserine decarboxylase
MVRDGYYYGAALALVAALAGWRAGWQWAIAPAVLGAFFLWFFRDPERVIPAENGLVVSPADGRVTAVAPAELDGAPLTRVSIFLNIFSVHVNRSPVAGTIESVEYRRGSFRNAMNSASSGENEQNVVTIRSEGQIIVFKQIAGLLARRIVFSKKIGDQVDRGERVGLIKFGSRTDVFLPRDATVQVKIGDCVHGGSSIVARLPERQ